MENSKPLQANGSTGLGRKGSIVTAALGPIAAADDLATKAIIGGIVAIAIGCYTFLEWSRSHSAKSTT